MTGALLDNHDLLLLDLDGVLYVGDQPVEGAAAALEQVRSRGIPVAFVTNNAARTPDAVAAQLQQLGVAATAAEVVTSAMAAARLLAEDLAPGTPVLVVGGAGVRQALLDVGLRPVAAAEDNPLAVVQGWAAEVGWPMLAEATVAVRAGARWVATNVDATLPSPRGPLPGNGSMVAALATALGRSPETVGKPEPALFETARRLAAGERPLVVGDRLDTDIAGARAAGIPSLLVLTGVSSAADLVSAAPNCRPDYIGRDLGVLAAAYPDVELAANGEAARCGGWTLRRSAAGIAIDDPADISDAADDEGAGLNGLRALCALAWSGNAPSRAALEAALNELGLD